MTDQAKSTGKAKKAVADKVAFKMLGTAAEINKAIDGIAKTGAAFEKAIHQAAVSCLAHCEKHHDITLMQRLLDALPVLTRRNSLKEWACTLGKFKWDEDANDGKGAFAYDKAKKTMIEEAVNIPFWKIKAEPVYVPFDLTKQITNIMQSAARARKHGEAVPEDKLAILQALKDNKPVHIDGLLEVPDALKV